MSKLEFDTLEDAELMNTVITQFGFIMHSLQGYTVDVQGVVPKKNGKDNPSAHVTKWDTPRQPQKEQYDFWVIKDPRDEYGDDMSGFIGSLTPTQAQELAQQFFLVDFTQEHIDAFMANPTLTTVIDAVPVTYRVKPDPYEYDYTPEEIGQLFGVSPMGGV